MAEIFPVSRARTLECKIIQSWVQTLSQLFLQTSFDCFLFAVFPSTNLLSKNKKHQSFVLLLPLYRSQVQQLLLLWYQVKILYLVFLKVALLVCFYFRPFTQFIEPVKYFLMLYHWSIVTSVKDQISNQLIMWSWFQILPLVLFSNQHCMFYFPAYF